MLGKLINIEGLDGSGKETQTKLLEKRLKEEGYLVKRVEFPNYGQESSVFVKMYLEGVFGKNPQDVNAYTASSFFALDRYASYKLNWESFYNNGGLILCDRYVTSNAIHQTLKIKTIEDKKAFFDWLYDFEYNKLTLPRPDLTIFLDVPVNVSEKLIKERNRRLDIHETNIDYLKGCYESVDLIRQELTVINCIENSTLRSIESINNELFDIIRSIL